MPRCPQPAELRNQLSHPGQPQSQNAGGCQTPASSWLCSGDVQGRAALASLGKCFVLLSLGRDRDRELSWQQTPNIAHPGSRAPGCPCSPPLGSGHTIRDGSAAHTAGPRQVLSIFETGCI